MRKGILLVVTTILLMSCTSTNHSNPLLGEWDTPYGVPPFDKIKTEHYLPAYQEALKEQRLEIDTIKAVSDDSATFQNIVVALDKSGSLLSRCNGVFFNLLETDGDEAMQTLSEKITALVTESQDAMLLDSVLFHKVQLVYDREKGSLQGEDLRLLTETYRLFVENGALLSSEKKARLMQIHQELAALSLKFAKNVQTETNAYKLFITDEDSLKGLPASVKTAAKDLAKANGREDAWMFYPSRNSFIPVLQYAENRGLREALHRAYNVRGDQNNANDNKGVIRQTLSLRQEEARLFGYDNPADHILANSMAKKGATAYDLLLKVWKPALAQAKKEAKELQKLLDQDIPGVKLQPWDWWYYTEKLRAQKYALDEMQLRPYFELNNVRQGVFAVAHKLFGLNFEKLENMPIYHPEVEVIKVTDADSNLVGIVYTDYFPRSTKRPGAWMNNLRDEHEGVRPIIVNVGNFTKPTPDAPSLLSMDEVETLFHEFGHALHGLLANTKYRSLSGTNVARDFVELPSQFMENYCYEPEEMRLYAKHYQTGEIIPDSLIEKLHTASHFNQGFVETELLSASILDLDYHQLKDMSLLPDDAAVDAFEVNTLNTLGLIPQITVRYRSTFFNHIFTTGYEAGYYSYTWSAVLDADAFAAFQETGDIFNPEVAKRWKHLLEQGNTVDPVTNYQEFRGKKPDVKWLLKRKGLL